jgi:hypothetical protein
MAQKVRVLSGPHLHFCRIGAISVSFLAPFPIETRFDVLSETGINALQAFEHNGERRQPHANPTFANPLQSQWLGHARNNRFL